jgi:hypothetical protein
MFLLLLGAVLSDTLNASAGTDSLLTTPHTDQMCRIAPVGQCSALAPVPCRLERSYCTFATLAPGLRP